MFDIDETLEDEPPPLPMLLNAVLSNRALVPFAQLLGGVLQITLLSVVAKTTRMTMFAYTIPMMQKIYCDHRPGVVQSNDQRRRSYAVFLRQLRDMRDVHRGTIPQIVRPAAPLIESIKIR